MQEVRIGDVTITSIIERDGPWRAPEAMFPDYDSEIGRPTSRTLIRWCTMRRRTGW